MTIHSFASIFSR